MSLETFPWFVRQSPIYLTSLDMTSILPVIFPQISTLHGNIFLSNLPPSVKSTSLLIKRKKTREDSVHSIRISVINCFCLSFLFLRISTLAFEKKESGCYIYIYIYLWNAKIILRKLKYVHEIS